MKPKPACGGGQQKALTPQEQHCWDEQMQRHVRARERGPRAATQASEAPRRACGPIGHQHRETRAPLPLVSRRGQHAGHRRNWHPAHPMSDAAAGPEMRLQPHQALKRLAQQLEAPRKTWSAAARQDPRNVPDLHAGSHARALGTVVVCTQCCSSVPSPATSCWVACVSSPLSRVSSSSRRAASGASPEGDITLVYPNTSEVAVLRRGNTVCRHF